MNFQPGSAQPQHPTDQPAEDAQYYRGVLHGLIDIGADLARLLHQQAKAQVAVVGAEPAPDLAKAFDRISRAVRRSIILARKVAEPVAIAEHPAQHRAAARRRIIREVEDTIQRTAGVPEAETLHAEFLDRLDAPDLDDDIDHRPIADIIADICRDLGVAAMPGTHPWKRRTLADLTALCARAAGSSAAGFSEAGSSEAGSSAAGPPDVVPPAALPPAVAPSAAPAFVHAEPPSGWTGSDPPPSPAEAGASLLPGGRSR